MKKRGGFQLAKSFYKVGGYYSYLINSGVEIKFSILGKALGMRSFDPLVKGDMQPVEVVSVLQQIGVNAIEIAIAQGSNFDIISNVSGDDIKKVINYLDADKACIFIGRLNTKIGDISYQQTFYVYREGQDFSEFIGGIK